MRHATKFRPVTLFSPHRPRFISNYVATFSDYAHEYLHVNQNRHQDDCVAQVFGHAKDADFLTATAPTEEIKFPDNLGGLPEVILTGKSVFFDRGGLPNDVRGLQVVPMSESRRF